MKNVIVIVLTVKWSMVPIWNGIHILFWDDMFLIHSTAQQINCLEPVGTWELYQVTDSRILNTCSCCFKNIFFKPIFWHTYILTSRNYKVCFCHDCSDCPIVEEQDAVTAYVTELDNMNCVTHSARLINSHSRIGIPVVARF